MNKSKILHLMIFIHFFSITLHKTFGAKLHNAISQEDKKTVERLLAAKRVHINSKNRNKMTPLCLAIEKGNNEIVQLLLKAAANVSAQCKNGKTALHLAVEKGNSETVQHLLVARADVNAQDMNGKTALHIAAERGNKKIVQFLLAAGADVNLQGMLQMTPLHLAVNFNWGNPEIVKLLIASGAELKAQDKNENTPLHLAVARGYRDIVQLLLERGAGAGVVNKNNKSVLHKALKVVLSRILSFKNVRYDVSNDYILKARINIFIELLLWSRYQTYADQSLEQNVHFFEVISHLDLNALNQNHILLNKAKNLILWIMAEVLKCQSKQEFFEKIFEYLLNSYPESQQDLLIENIQHLILQDHNIDFYPQKKHLSDSQQKKHKKFKIFLRHTYAKKLKKEFFNDLSPKALEVKLKDLNTLRKISSAIIKYCQNNSTKSSFLRAILKMQDFNKNAAIRTWAQNYHVELNPTAKSIHSNVFKAHFEDIKCLVRDVYVHLNYIIQQPQGSDRLDSDTMFGKVKNSQDILDFKS